MRTREEILEMLSAGREKRKQNLSKKTKPPKIEKSLKKQRSVKEKVKCTCNKNL